MYLMIARVPCEWTPRKSAATWMEVKVWAASSGTLAACKTSTQKECNSSAVTVTVAGSALGSDCVLIVAWLLVPHRSLRVGQVSLIRCQGASRLAGDGRPRIL